MRMLGYWDIGVFGATCSLGVYEEYGFIEIYIYIYI